MGREVWGAFSVRDHRQPRAFVSEVLLYDRLVVPVPPDDAERARWIENGWDPARLDRLLDILGDRARKVAWDERHRKQWGNLRRATEIVNAETSYRATAGVLIQNLPKYVTGVDAVASYGSLEELEINLGLRPTAAPPGDTSTLYPLPGGTICAVLGHELLVPDDPRRSDEELLRIAVELADDNDFRRKRTQFHRWQREFLADGVTDPESVRAALEEMRELLEEEKASIMKHRAKVGVQFAFTVAAIAVSLLGTPISALALGGAFISVGKFAADEWFRKQDPTDERMMAAMFRDAQRRLGWEEA